MKMKIYPKSSLGVIGFWLTLAGTILLALKINGTMPLPTMALFGLIFVGAGLSIWALVKGDRSWLQWLVVLPIFVLAAIWTLAEVIWPH